MDRNLHSYWFKANQRDHDDIADAIEKRFKSRSLYGSTD